MSRYYEDPNTGQKVKIQKTHRFRNFVVLPAAGLLALGVVVSVATGGETPAPAGTVQAPAPNTTGGPSRLEAFGSGEASVSVTSQGTAMNTVQLPHAVDLPQGYVSVTVTRSPSLESFQQGGPDTGEVGCRIVRGSEVVDEQRATGQFASASCTKWR